MDTQPILLLILLLLSVNLVLVGVYIVLVLRDVRRLVQNVNEFVNAAKSGITNITTVSAVLPLLVKTASKVYKGVKDGKKK